MNNYIIFSLIAIAPLMLSANDSFVEEEYLEEECLEAFFESERESSVSTQNAIQDEIAKESTMQEELSYKQSDRAVTPTSFSDPECTLDIQPYQVRIGHIEGKGVGYDTGYTTLETFFAPTYGKYTPFFDARGHVFDNGYLAANLGLGLRYAYKPKKYLFGINGYYDYRQTKRGHYNQIGAGIEAFKGRWEFRANGYLPVGEKKFQYDKSLTGISFKGFEGNHILINEFYDAKVEYAMKGFNAEIGAHLIAPQPVYDLYAGVGTYYFIGDVGKNTWGGKIRLSGKVTKYISLEISDSFDRIFHNRFQGQIVLSYPFGSKKLRMQKQSNSSTCFSDNIMYLRAVQPVQRQDAVVVNNKKNPFVIDPVAIDPTTGQPFFVVFVNNTNPSLGDGTFENPFQNLSPADNATNAQTASAEGNTIYVFSGDGLTTHMQHGIQLKSNQRFLGSSIAHTYQTTLGTLLIPPQTASKPHIEYPGTTNSGDYGIKITDNTEVSGFHITSNSNASPPDGQGIGNIVMGGGAVITNNLIDRATIGIKLGAADPVTGNYIISNNVTTSISGHASSVEGVGLRLRLGNGTALISDNQFNNSSGGPVGASGLVVETYSSEFPVRVDILNNQLNNNENEGLRISFTNETNFPAPRTGSVCVNVEGNAIHQNIRTEILASSNIGLADSFSIPHLILNNNMTGANHVAIETATTGSALCARVTNNTSTLQFSSSNGSYFYLEPLIGNVGSWSSTGTLLFTEQGECNCP